MTFQPTEPSSQAPAFSLMKIFMIESDDNKWVYSMLHPKNPTAIVFSVCSRWNQKQLLLAVIYPGHLLGIRQQPLPLPAFYVLVSRVPSSASSSGCSFPFLPVDSGFSYWKESLLLFMRVGQRPGFRAIRNLRKISNFAPLLGTDERGEVICL